MTATFYNQQQSFQQEQSQDVPCVEFSAMGFGSHMNETSSYPSEQSFATSSTVQTNLSGWGSAVSRKSYACLKTLGENEARKEQKKMTRMPRTAAPVQGDSWGYFVDTPDVP
jgi:hypothetical protein